MVYPIERVSFLHNNNKDRTNNNIYVAHEL